MLKGKCPVCKIVGALVVIGAVNWGLVGILQIDLVAKLLGDMTIASRVVYGLIGLAGLMSAAMCVKACPCGNKEGSCPT